MRFTKSTIYFTLAGLLLFFQSIVPAFAQEAITGYRGFKNDSLLTVRLLKQTIQKLEADKAKATGENKKYIINEYQERFEHVKELYEKKILITDPEAKAYIDSLTARIIQKNPILQPLKPNVFFSRMYWPNASSMGEGTIIMNISLFNRLKNESQAAFILCHELSHLYLEHSNKAIDRYVNTLYSKEFQQQLKEIKRSEYQQGRSLDKLVKNISYKSRRHSRDHEMEADSLALELLKPTGFDVREALSCLALLDSVDKEKYDYTLHLPDQFNFSEYPFRASWIRKARPSLRDAMDTQHPGGETEEADSLKTHPECSARIARLKEKTSQYYNSSQQPFLVSRPIFDSIINRFDFELIEYCFHSDKVDRALYYAVQMFYENRQNVYLATMISKCIYRLYMAQRDHFLGNITDTSPAYSSKTYDQYLQFIKSVTLKDLASINYYFMKQQYPVFHKDPDFTAAYQQSVSVFNSINNN